MITDDASTRSRFKVGGNILIYIKVDLNEKGSAFLWLVVKGTIRASMPGCI